MDTPFQNDQRRANGQKATAAAYAGDAVLLNAEAQRVYAIESKHSAKMSLIYEVVG
jgi:hypothetical protein